MARKEISAGWDRENRNAMNDNFTELYAQKQIAEEAKSTAEQALAQSQDTRTQLDQIIVEGDSSVEAAAARVDEDGTAHSTLKARLDSGFTEVKQQLAQKEQEINNLTLNKAEESDLIELKNYVTGVSVNDLEYPIFVAHRGGKHIHPENSKEAFIHSSSAEFPIELDVRMNADGIPVISHDATMTRTTNRDGPISNYTVPAFINARITALGTEYEGTPVTLEELFIELGNKAIYVVEPKEREVVPLIIELIKKYRLKDNIIFQSFDRSDLDLALDMGIFTGFLSDTAISNPHQLKADGIDYVAMRKTVSDSAVQNCKDVGLDVWIYTVNTRYEAEDFLNKGADAIITDDPLWVSKKSKVINRDNFNQQTWFHGQFAPPAVGNFKGVRGEFIPHGKFGWTEAYNEAGLDYCLQGWTGELTENFEFKIDIFPEELAGPTRWAGIAFCTAYDFYNNETSPSSGYNVIFRENGEMALYKNVDGSSTLLSSANGPLMVMGTRLTVTITVQGSNILIKRTDSQAPNLQLSVNDTQFRNGFLHLGRNRTGVVFGNGTYTTL